MLVGVGVAVGVWVGALVDSGVGAEVGTGVSTGTPKSLPLSAMAPDHTQPIIPLPIGRTYHQVPIGELS